MNVVSRIKLTYGNKYGIYIDIEPDVGTEGTIKIPITLISGIFSVCGTGEIANERVELL